MFVLVDAYGAAESIVFGTCCVNSGCTEQYLFVSPPMVRQRHKEADGPMLLTQVISVEILEFPRFSTMDWNCY